MFPAKSASIRSLIVSTSINLNQQPNLLQLVDQSASNKLMSLFAVALTLPWGSPAKHEDAKKWICVVQECIQATFGCKNGSSRQITARIEVAQSISTIPEELTEALMNQLVIFLQPTSAIRF